MEVSLQSGSRPPYVKFETRGVEDRNASLAKGRRIERDVDWVIVRQAGAKDTFEAEAETWLSGLDKDPNMHPDWVAGFKNGYARWKEGHEPTPTGTHINSWPAISKNEASLLLAADIRTVEDLATANEASLSRVGMGARTLQTKARDFLKMADTTGKGAEELSALRAKTEGQAEVIARQESELKRLASLVEGLSQKIAGSSVEKALEQAPADPDSFM